MKTLVTAIQKGGQGKTFATCNLAFDFAERGLRVLVIDLDAQGNASYTLANHKIGYPASSLFRQDEANTLVSKVASSENKGISVIEADSKLANLDHADISKSYKAFYTNIRAIGDYFDVCLIDTAPSLGVAMTAAVLCSDYLISPIELEAYSLQGMQKLVSIVGNLRKQNPKLRFLGMIPNKVDSRKPRHMENLKGLQKAYPQLVVPFRIGARDSIAESLGSQIPVWKLKKTAARAAAKEVRVMTNFIHDAMELS